MKRLFERLANFWHNLLHPRTMTYTVHRDDMGTLELPDPSGDFVKNCPIRIHNQTGRDLLVRPSKLEDAEQPTIDGMASFVLRPGQRVVAFADGKDYYTMRGIE
jgi:hypothetical protein